MQPTTRRTQRRRRWTPAVLLAVVAFTALVVAGPAVARPAHGAHVSGAALSVPGIIAVAVIAVFGALALVLFAVLGTRRGGTVTGATVHQPGCVRRTHRNVIAA